MPVLNNILKELKNVPVNRLEEVYEFIRSISPKAIKITESRKKKILSFGGAFSDMSNKDYSDFLEQTKKTRSQLFNRNIYLRIK